MTLEEKYKRMACGGGILRQPFARITSNTIEDLWNDFIEPRLPRVETVIAWHKILMNYVARPDAVFVLRIFNENNEDIIRRGFYTQTNDGYSFFYTDNSFAYYIARMVLDGDCIPTADEFFEFCKNRKIPYRLKIGGLLYNEEKYANAFPASTRNPWITTYHKLAHLYSVGERFNWNEKQNLNIAEVAGTLFPRGNHEDWHLTGEASNQYYVRNWEIADENKDETKRLLIAHFLRFVHPMNYFLAPKMPLWGRVFHKFTLPDGSIRNDIGEYEPLLRFVRSKFHERYTVDGHDYYQEFLDQILPFVDESLESGNMLVNVTYSSEPLNVGEVTQQPAAHPRVQHAATPRVNTPRGEAPVIELVPPDVAQFKAALLRTRSAQRTWIFADGTERTETWDASRMTENSDIMANIRTNHIFKKWRENGVVRVRIVVNE